MNVPVGIKECQTLTPNKSFVRIIWSVTDIWKRFPKSIYEIIVVIKSQFRGQNEILEITVRLIRPSVQRIFS